MHLMIVGSFEAVNFSSIFARAQNQNPKCVSHDTNTKFIRSVGRVSHPDSLCTAYKCTQQRWPYNDRCRLPSERRARAGTLPSNTFAVHWAQLQDNPGTFKIRLGIPFYKMRHFFFCFCGAVDEVCGVEPAPRTEPPPAPSVGSVLLANTRSTTRSKTPATFTSFLA